MQNSNEEDSPFRNKSRTLPVFLEIKRILEENKGQKIKI
jgi:hypothetical protein